MLSRTEWLISGLVVYPERMRKNLDMTKGLVFSGQLLLDLAAAGMMREEAYSLVQSHAMTAWAEDGDFRAQVESDPHIHALLSASQLAKSFSVERQLANVDAIFRRVFNSSGHSPKMA